MALRMEARAEPVAAEVGSLLPDALRRLFASLATSAQQTGLSCGHSHGTESRLHGFT